jgi:hypothetical protein
MYIFSVCIYALHDTDVLVSGMANRTTLVAGMCLVLNGRHLGVNVNVLYCNVEPKFFCLQQTEIHVTVISRTSSNDACTPGLALVATKNHQYIVFA